jgi:hypothetical protein
MPLGNAVNATSTGLQSLTSAGVFNGRTLTGTANQFSVSNGDGVSGNPTVSLTSTIYVSGISFDSGSNTLSNYVTGTFTPTITNTGSAPTVTYSSQLGRFTYIGNRVFCMWRVVVTAYTAGTGNVNLSSFPYTSNNTTNNDNIGAVSLDSVTAGASVIYYVAKIVPNSTVCVASGIRNATTTLDLVASGPIATFLINTTINYQV